MRNFEKIQYISQGETAEIQFKNIENALKNGAKWIQLRWKDASKNDLKLLAQKVKILCKNFNATYIINDDVDLVAEVDADGVHLGLDDLNILKAREILGSEKIIGGTANTFEDVQQRISENCDYIGLGPLRFTSTKKKLSPILGFEAYQKIINQLQQNNIYFPPIFAIGGITKNDIQPLQNIGIYGVVFSQLITDKPALIQELQTEFI
ncbi:thiamine phosphate synthase [Soonwooa sp.]|uniref:thiamine phosphate synthase n=1 Tax=Soonwooa sp. TaxID=1938592 RepID=UPI0028AE2E27|nr:thiamine phosphate synthase [Soonwooa sp.]